MASRTETLLHTANLVQEFRNKYQAGLHDRRNDHDSFTEIVKRMEQQTEHVANTLAPIADQAQNLLDSLCDKQK